ncbi:MAG: phosphoenolpyruvate--protein phosphotransferase [Spirochaetales bacterium]|nr:phosphoenolpyruvate--protein phosphotransferase [Spirochaetales bacterium]
MNKIGAETHLKGIQISEGIVLAKVCLINEDRHRNIPEYEIDDIQKEKDRLLSAVKIAGEQLGNVIEDVEERIGVAESKIFVAQKMILEDETVHEDLFTEIGNRGVNAESAVNRVMDSYEARLLDVDNEYIKARATDIGEIKRRLLDVLAEVNPTFLCSGLEQCEMGKNRIIVARELTPGLTIGLDARNTAGFVTEHGGKLSHAAILAKSLGVPAVSGIKNIHSLVSCGTEILINGDIGEVVIWPSQETIAQHRVKKTFVLKSPVAEEPVKGTQVMANISFQQDIKEALAMKAEGIGLYRTEFEFLARGRYLSEDEQFDIYSSVLKSMNGLPIYFRLLDIGGEKSADFLELPKEANPALGFRGSRLLVARKKLLKTQARALARASVFGPVYILYPLIIDLEQFLLLKNTVLHAVSDIHSGEIYHGVMFEVPSACLQADELLKESDFASIGTNDLIQYLFIVDRDNEYVAYDYTPDKKVFWNLLKTIATAAAKLNRSVSICGEIAGNTRYLPILKEIGFSTLSVSARLIPVLRKALKKVKNPVRK